MVRIVLPLSALLSLSTAESFKGKATLYGPADGVDVFSGNCGLMDALPTARQFQVAMNLDQYQQGIHCGRCIQAQCTDARCKDTPKVTGQVTNTCPGCAKGDLTFSYPFFKQLTGATTDWFQIAWEFVDCPVAGGVKVCAKSGSSPYWLAVQPTNTVGGVQSMSVNGKPARYATEITNYYFQAEPKPEVPLSNTTVTMTSFNGETITATVALTEGKCTEIPQQFGKPGTPTPTPSNPTPTPSNPTPTSSNPTPTPTTSDPTPSTCGAPEANIDYYGNDVGSLNVVGPQADQIRVCCSACTKNDRCNAFSVAGETCYLKSSADGRKVAPGVVSARKASAPTPTPVTRACGSPEWNTDMFGNDLSNFKAYGDFTSMLAQCCDGCKKTASCAAFTLADGVCYLKNTVGNRQATSGATSVAMVAA